MLQNAFDVFDGLLDIVEIVYPLKVFFAIAIVAGILGIFALLFKIVVHKK